MVLSFIDEDSCGGWGFINKLKKIIGSKQCFPFILPRLVVGGVSLSGAWAAALLEISWSLLFKEMMLLEGAKKFSAKKMFWLLSGIALIA